MSLVKNSNLREDIRRFRRRKAWYAVPLLILGIVGLVLPIMPGWILIFLAIFLLFPATGDKIIERLKRLKNRFFPKAEQKS